MRSIGEEEAADGNFRMKRGPIGTNLMMSEDEDEMKMMMIIGAVTMHKKRFRVHFRAGTHY